MKLYLLSNGQFLWKTTHYEFPCASIKEVFQIGVTVFQIPVCSLESGLVQMEELGDNYVLFDEMGSVIRTDKSDI